MANPTTLLLDTDIVAYKFSAANEQSFDWDGDGDKVRVTEDIEDVMVQTIDYVEELKVKLKADELIVCLSCPTSENFRLSILPTYKGNRDPAKKPLQLGLVKQRLADHYPSYERPTLEADDIMGILSTHPTLVKGKKVIVSEDKDMKTIPGWLFNPRKDQKPKLISEADADYFHLYQTLIGDSTDHYSGCPDVGPVNATEVLDNPYLLVPYDYEFKRGPRKGMTEVRYEKVPTEDRWAAIVSQFERQGLTEDDALVQARVARILRASDYNFKTKEVILWKP